MSGPINQHKEYAQSGKPSQEDTKYSEKEPKRTEFAEDAKTPDGLHSTEKNGG